MYAIRSYYASLWKPNWNKSFELPVSNPKGAVLLLHGMSDSPYSLHTQAEYLHKNGFWVLGLRMPGHGTIPSGLRNMKWQDMAAVVELGMKHLEEKLGSKPIHIMGYSTGAPLALNYTFKALEKKSLLRVPNSLVFYSPAMGVSAAAPLAVWQSRVGYLLGLPKLEWNSLLPEYDPFKYGSFAVNAGDQVYRLTKAVQKQFDKLDKHPSTKTFPPVLSFSSIVDSTVSVPAVVDNLFNRLPKGKHTLVFFDINHNFDRNHLVKSALSTNIQILRDTAINENYTFELISNMHTKNRSVERIVNHKEVTALPHQWSKDLYSLSHLAMPISPSDPLYGNKDAPKSPGIQLGYLAIYGETGVLQISSASLLRQRWNPFHSYIKQRVLAFLKPVITSYSIHYTKLYDQVAIQTRQQGTNVVSFYLHPNGDISGLRLKTRIGYAALDENTIKVIKLAYKDYPLPNKKTRLIFYVRYSIY